MRWHGGMHKEPFSQAKAAARKASDSCRLSPPPLYPPLPLFLEMAEGCHGSLAAPVLAIPTTGTGKAWSGGLISEPLTRIPALPTLLLVR